MPLNFIALGGAERVWEDYEKARALCPYADVGAVNEAGRDYEGRLTVWATLHPEKSERWHRERSLAGRNMDFTAVSHKRIAGARVDTVYSDKYGGSSGLYLCDVALNLGYQRVIVCGIPMDGGAHYFDANEWNDFKTYRRGWRKAAELGRIRSLSGWTRELLGAPNREWLAVPDRH